MSLYVPITSPPTPEPSPIDASLGHLQSHPSQFSVQFSTLSPPERRQFLLSLLELLSPSELSLISSCLAHSPSLKRDFMADLPPELAIHVIRYLAQDPLVILRASTVSRTWRRLMLDDASWRAVVANDEMSTWRLSVLTRIPKHFSYYEHFKQSYLVRQGWCKGGKLLCTHNSPDGALITSLALSATHTVAAMSNANIHIFSTTSGRLLCTLKSHNPPAQGNGPNREGVWAVSLIEATPQSASASTSTDSLPGPHMLHPNASSTSTLPSRTTPCPRNSVPGYGNTSPLVVSGGCEKVIRVWDLDSGNCLHVLHGHRSTIRCLVTLPGRPITISGSRDTTLRVWNIQTGRLIRTLSGHTGSVRMLDAFVPSSSTEEGARVVSGSYDRTVRLWDIDAGTCLHVFTGHTQNVYAVAFSLDGRSVASGGLDTCVRVWSTETGKCTAMLSGHTALVCTVQFTPTTLASGGADGRVLLFGLPESEDDGTEGPRPLQALAAHDSSVAALQLEDGFPFLVSAGDDGRVRIFTRPSTPLVGMSSSSSSRTSPQAPQGTSREIHIAGSLSPSTAPPQSSTTAYTLGTRFDAIWRLLFSPDGERMVVAGKRSGRTIVEVWGFDGTAEPTPPNQTSHAHADEVQMMDL